MAENIKQVYDGNPSTTIPDDALLYLGLTPYTPTDNSAIKSQDIFPTNATVANGDITLFNGTSGKKLKKATLTNGQLLIGSTGVAPVAGGPTNGTNISWTTGAGTLTATISSTLGGTGVISPTIHGIMIAQGSSPMVSLILTNGQLAIGSTGANPVAAAPTNGTNISWTTGAGSLTANLSGIVSPANGGTGFSDPTASRLMITNGSSAFNLMNPLTTGQVVAGITATDPAPFTLTAGTNITSIDTDTGAKTITFNAAVQTVIWQEVVDSNEVTLEPNHGYLANSPVDRAIFALPVLSPPQLGDQYVIQGFGAALFRVVQLVSGYIMRFGTHATTVGTDGLIDSVDQYTKVVITYMGANAFEVDIASGNISYV